MEYRKMENYESGNRESEIMELMLEASELPRAMDTESIKKRVKAKRARHMWVVGFRNASVIVVAVVFVAVIGISTSNVFAQAVKDVPIIGSIAKTIKPDLKEEINEGNLMLTLSNAAVGNEKLMLTFSLICNGEYGEENGEYRIEPDRIVRTDNKRTIEAKMISADTVISADGTNLLMEFNWNRSDEEITAGQQIYLKLKRFGYEEREEGASEPMERYCENFVFDIAPQILPDRNVYGLNSEIEYRGQTFSVVKSTDAGWDNYLNVLWRDDNSMKFCGMKFALLDADKNVLWTNDGREIKNGARPCDDGVWNWHYSYGLPDKFRELDGVSIQITEIYLLPHSMENMYYNTESMIFYDDEGELGFVRAVKLSDIQKRIYYSGDAPNSSYVNGETVYFTFEGNCCGGDYSGYNVLKRKCEGTWVYGKNVGRSLGFSRNFTLYSLWTYEADEDGIIHFIREYPEYIEDPGIDIVII